MLLHIRSGETYPITFLLLQPYDVEDHMQDWDAAFDWSIYFGQPGFEVYKMVVTGNDVIQGVIAIERKSDHVYIHLIESAPHNRYDTQFKYVGLHLVAFACKRSVDLGHDGFVALRSKTHPRLMQYYMNLVGATHISGGNMVIDESVAKRLIMLYLS